MGATDRHGVLRPAVLGRIGAAALLLAALVTGLWMHAGRSVAVANLALAEASCSRAPLPTIGGRYGDAVAANQQGVAVGAATDATGASHAVLWRSGKVERIAAGTAGSVAVALNARGEVVGTARSDTDAVGWAWSGGVTTALKAEHGRVAVPSAINDRGLIVGALAESAAAHGTVPNDDENEQAAWWASARAAPRELSPLPGDDGGYAFAVDNRGRIAGMSAGTRFRPVVWAAPGASPSALQDLGGGYAAVRTLSDSGVAAGDAVGTDGTDHPVMWDPAGRIVDLGLPAGAKSGQARAILRNGAIIGTAELPLPGGGVRSQAVQWLAPRHLLLLPSAGTGGASSAAGATDANGFVGNVMDPDGGRHPVRWQCGK
jgi:uncharacterized membrane protein